MRYVTRARRQQLSMGGIFVRLDSSLNLIEDWAKYIYVYDIYNFRAIIRATYSFCWAAILSIIDTYVYI